MMRGTIGVVLVMAALVLVFGGVGTAETTDVNGEIFFISILTAIVGVLVGIIGVFIVQEEF